MKPMNQDLVSVWPLFGLRLATPRLELRLVRDEDLPGIVDAVLAGIHDPARMPFSVPWTDAPRHTLVRETLRHTWRMRANIRPESWDLGFVVCRNSVPIGMQDLNARDFSVTRTVGTGSWLSQPHQGQGYGKEMRSAVLAFAFDHLGAEVAESDAAVWNESSLGVSRSLGYVANGVRRVVARPGEVMEQQQVRLEAKRFLRPGWQLSVEGAEAAREELLAAPGTAASAP